RLGIDAEPGLAPLGPTRRLVALLELGITAHREHPEAEPRRPLRRRGDAAAEHQEGAAGRVGQRRDLDAPPLVLEFLAPPEPLHDAHRLLEPLPPPLHL